MEKPKSVYLRIVRQPAHNKQRFRYPCEGRNPEILYGEDSTKKNRTFPTVEIVGYKGPVTVVASCVEDKSPHRVHPNKLIDRNSSSKQSVCSRNVDVNTMTCSFENIGIQCIKRQDIPDSLAQRRSIKVDPFNQKFDHSHSSVNPYILRLCFQAFLKHGNSYIPLFPVVSNIIADSRAHAFPKIHDISDDWSYTGGGKKIILLTNKVYKDDIEVHFTNELDEKRESWHAKGNSLSVHKQHAITFLTPPYNDEDLTCPVTVYMYLYKSGLDQRSEYIEFKYIPPNNDNEAQKKYFYQSLSSEAEFGAQNIVNLPINSKRFSQNLQFNGIPQSANTQEYNIVSSKDSLNLSDIVDLELCHKVDSNLHLRYEQEIPDLLSISQSTEHQASNGFVTFRTIDNIFDFLDGIQ